MKGIKSKKYKHIYSAIQNGKKEVFAYWFTYKGVNYKDKYDTEKQAALQCDLKLISLGKEPVNILTKKIN